MSGQVIIVSIIVSLCGAGSSHLLILMLELSVRVKQLENIQMIMEKLLNVKATPSTEDGPRFSLMSTLNPNLETSKLQCPTFPSGTQLDHYPVATNISGSMMEPNLTMQLTQELGTPKDSILRNTSSLLKTVPTGKSVT